MLVSVKRGDHGYRVYLDDVEQKQCYAADDKRGIAWVYKTDSDGDVMLDAVLHSKVWWFIIGQDSLEVKGTVVKTRGN